MATHDGRWLGSTPEVEDLSCVRSDGMIDAISTALTRRSKLCRQQIIYQRVFSIVLLTGTLISLVRPQVAIIFLCSLAGFCSLFTLLLPSLRWVRTRLRVHSA